MSDLISRQAVLASIKNLYPDMPVIDYLGARRKWLEKYTPYFECENVVEQLPSVENKGEWIDSSNGWTCSICNRDSKRDTDFCPNCGAKMKGW